jgi:hypothetical protein
MSKVTIEDLESDINKSLENFHSKKKTPLEFDLSNKKIDSLKADDLTSFIESIHTAADSKLGITRYKLAKSCKILGSIDPISAIKDETSRSFAGLDKTKDAFEIAGTLVSRIDPKKIPSTKLDDIIIRDATGQKPDQELKRKDQIPETFVLSMASTTRGALKIIESSTMEKDKKNLLKAQVLEEFKSRAKDMLSKPSLSSKEIKTAVDKTRGFEVNLLNTLEKEKLTIKSGVAHVKLSDTKKTKKMLSMMRDAENFQDNQTSIATITKPDEALEVVTQFSARIKSMSDSQVDLVRNAAKFVKEHGCIKPRTYREFFLGMSKKRKTQFDQAKKAGVYEILSNMKPSQQVILAENSEHLDGSKTIPTSLQFIPGLRNAYYQVDLVGKEAVSKNFRFGSPSYFTPDYIELRKEQTRENLEHYIDLAKTKDGLERKVDVQIYNPFSWGSGILKAFGVGGGAYDERKISTTLLQVSQEDKFKDRLSASFVGAQEYLNKDKMIDEILKQDNSKISAVSCKSGKDRTGISSEFRLFNALAKKKSSDLSHDHSELAANILKAGHSEEIAGGFGGNHGSMGKKTEPLYKYLNFIDLGASRFGKYSWIESQKIRDIQENKVASLNKIKGKVKDKKHAEGVSASFSVANPLSDLPETSRASRVEKIRSTSLSSIESQNSISSDNSAISTASLENPLTVQKQRKSIISKPKAVISDSDNMSPSQTPGTNSKGGSRYP